MEMTPGEVATNLRALSQQDLNERRFKFDQQQAEQQNVFRRQELGNTLQQLQQGQQQLLQSDRELVTDAFGKMFFVSKTGAPSAVVSGPSGEALKVKGRDIPTPVTEEFIKNKNAVESIDLAIKSITDNPRAIGPVVGNIPQSIRDPLSKDEEIEARARVARIGSLLIKDTSGATVTVGESSRLKPFIPLPTDNPDAAKVKLRLLAEEIRRIEKERELQYSGQGLKYPSLSESAPIPGAPSVMDQYGLMPRR